MGKESTSNTGDLGSIPGSGRSPGGRNGNLLQYSYLKNPIDRGSWQATVHRVTKSQTRLKQLSANHAWIWYLGYRVIRRLKQETKLRRVWILHIKRKLR